MKRLYLLLLMLLLTVTVSGANALADDSVTEKDIKRSSGIHRLFF